MDVRICFRSAGSAEFALLFESAQCPHAELDPDQLAVDHDPLLLHVRNPPSAGVTLGVGNFISRTRSFSGYRTYSTHDKTSPSIK